MIAAIIRFCVRERLVVLLLTAGVVIYGVLCTKQVPIDAIPNVGENQVIVFAKWPGRSPKDVEDQITHPLSKALGAVPQAETVRGKSMFGYSFVQVTFSDDTDFYWARSRVAEQLTSATTDLPEGVTATLGPDATGLGQIFYYVLDAPGHLNLAELRSMQDYVVKYELEAVDGVSEVASVGGYVRQYQIEVAPDKLRFHNIPLDHLIKAVKESNLDVGAKTVESNGMEYVIRGRGFLGSKGGTAQAIQDIENTVVVSRDGIPVRIRDLGQVQVGPDFRRGAIDLNGAEVVGGVVVMRFGENPRQVIDAIRRKIAQIEPGLGGVKIKAIYDRTGLIDETVGTLSKALREEILITSVVILLFLLHVRSSLIVASTLPIAVLISFVGMRHLNVNANIMSLAGIAIAIGTMVDMAIIVSESIYGRLSDWESEGRPGGAEARIGVIHSAAVEVAPAIVTAVTTTVVSFLPVFLLTGRDHRLFSPLAWTKSFAIVSALIVAITVVPVLSRLLLTSNRVNKWIRVSSGGVFSLLAATSCILLWGKHAAAQWGIPLWLLTLGAAAIAFGMGFLIVGERMRTAEDNPLSRGIHRAYEPTLRFFLRHKFSFLCAPTLVVLLGIGAWRGLSSVLRPLERVANAVGADLNGLPGYVGFKHRFRGLETDDWIALDEGTWFYMPTLYPAASFSQAMEILQTQDALIRQIPEVENVLGKIGRVESALDPAPAAMIETYVTLKPKSEWREGMTEMDIWQQITDVATLPGVTPASPLQPIEGRVIMLQSGIKASMAVRIYGDSLEELSKASLAVANRLKKSPYVVAKSVNPDIVMGKPYVEFEVNRASAARYGMSTAKVVQVVEAALGGMNVTKTVEGRESYPVRVRYQRHLRERMDDLSRLPVVTPTGEVVPLATLTNMETTWGPGIINSEDARLVAHVSFSPSNLLGAIQTADRIKRDLRKAQADRNLAIPNGYGIDVVGSFEEQVVTNQRMWWLGPLLGIPPPSEDDGALSMRRLLWSTPIGLVAIVIIINFLIMYLQFRSFPLTFCAFVGIPVAFAGGAIFIAIAQVKLNTAVLVGFIALFGIAVDDGVVLATYLKQTFSRQALRSIAEIRNATVQAGLRRIRPCLMTTTTTLAALMPVLLSTGRGAAVAKAMAWPVFGGMVVELLTLFVVPVVFCGYMELKHNLGFDENRTEIDTQPTVPSDAPS